MSDPRSRRIRSLTEHEIDSYDLVDEALARRVKVARIPRLPGRYTGLTLGPIVFVSCDVPDDGTSSLLAHELVHVRQWHEQGVPRFAWCYASSFARGLARQRRWNDAYRAIPAEVEAREDASRWYLEQRNRAGHDERPW